MSEVPNFNPDNLTTEEMLEQVAVVIEGLDTSVELSKRIADTSYDQVSQELWREVRDFMPVVQFMCGLVKGSMMIGSQLIGDETVQTRMEAFTDGLELPDPKMLGLEIPEDTL